MLLTGLHIYPQIDNGLPLHLSLGLHALHSLLQSSGLISGSMGHLTGLISLPLSIGQKLLELGNFLRGFTNARQMTSQG